MPSAEIMADSRSVLLNEFLSELYCICGLSTPVPQRSRRGSAADPLLGLRVRILPRGKDMSLVSVLCCQVKVSQKGRSLVQGSPTGCDMSLWVIQKLQE
jgi:hypothetical protein